jgi:hypothetical protein
MDRSNGHLSVSTFFCLIINVNICIELILSVTVLSCDRNKQYLYLTNCFKELGKTVLSGVNKLQQVYLPICN